MTINLICSLLCTRDTVFRVYVDRHAAAVVGHFDRAIFMKCDLDIVAITSQGFIDTVVDNFLNQVIGLGGICVHAGTALYRFKSLQNFNILGLVLFTHFPGLLTFRVLLAFRLVAEAESGSDSDGSNAQDLDFTEHAFVFNAKCWKDGGRNAELI